MLFGVAAALSAALQAMGGEGTLTSISAIEYRAVGYREMVEQSEHPDGPYFLDSLTIHEVRDIRGKRVRIERDDGAYAGMDWWLTQTAPYHTTALVNGDATAVVDKTGVHAGGSSFLDFDLDERLFQPELVLLNALRDPHAHVTGTAVRHGVAHDVLQYTAYGVRCKLSISRQTHLPWQVTFTRAFPYNTFLSAWGDVPTTVTYNGWTLEPDGLVFPREWTITRLGLPDMQLALTSVTLNPKYDAADLTIPAAARPKGGPTGVDQLPLGARGSGAPHQIAPGVTTVPGAWNLTFVRQGAGVVLLEAPWSSNYVKQALAYTHNTLHARVTAVVTTSDSWPHIAGLREIAAAHIPIYALDLNVPIIKRLLAAPHRLRPDDLQKHPAPAIIHPVTSRTVLGTGENRLLLIPYRAATAERQMMVYLPAHQLLYTSDLFAPIDIQHWFTPEYLREAIGVVEREHLRVQTIFGMHYDATPYTQITRALQRYRTVDSSL